MPEEREEKQIFHQARAISDASARETYLRNACSGNLELRAKVDALLAAMQDADNFLENSPFSNEDLHAAYSTEPQIGSSIGGYQLLEKIGEGGFAVVYLAEQREPVRRKVAIKIIKAGMDTKQVIARFEAERQALAMMEHPHIAKAFEASATDNGRPYFVMELVRGVPLTEYCDRNGLTTSNRLRLFVEICSAVQHAHQKGVIHRDLKPGNILVYKEGNRSIPKIIDFGIAKATTGKLTDKTLISRFHHFIGTPVYMSPEQVQGTKQNVDTRSDVYSLGVLLYELLTGVPPFDPDELAEAGFEEMCRRIRELSAVRPSKRLTTLDQTTLSEVAGVRRATPVQLCNAVRGELDWIVMKAIAKEPDRRYNTADAFAMDVRNYLDDQPISAAPPSRWYQFRTFARRNRRLLVTLTTVAASLLAATIFSSAQARRANNASERAMSAEQKATRDLYLREMRVAQIAVQQGNYDQAKAILARHVPDGDEPDLRNFEYFQLRYAIRQEKWESDTNASVHDVAVSPDGKQVACISRLGQVQFLRARDGVLTGSGFDVSDNRRFNLTWKGWLRYSKDGTRLFVACPRLEQLIEWNVQNQRIENRYSLQTPTDAKLTHIESDPEYQTAITSYDDGTIRLWSLAGGDAVETACLENVHAGEICRLAVSQNGKKFASATHGVTKVWSIETGEQIRSFTNAFDGTPRCNAHNLQFVGNDRLASAIETVGLRVLDVATGTVEFSDSQESTDVILKLAYAEHTSTLAVGSWSGEIRLLDTRNWAERQKLQQSGHQFSTLAISGDGTTLYSGGENNRVMAWDISTLSDDLLPDHPSYFSSLSFAPNGLLAVGCTDRSVTIWNPSTEEMLLRIGDTDPHLDKIQETLRQLLEFFSFNHDGSQVALIARPQTVEVWDIANKKIVDTLLLDHEGDTVKFSPRGRYLAVGETDRMRLWATESRSFEVTIPTSGRVVSVAFSPTEEILVWEDWGGPLKVWDLGNNQLRTKISVDEWLIGNSYTLEFSPDGRALAVAGYDGVVTILDTETWKPQQSLVGHTSLLIDLAFSHDGTRLISTELMGNAKLWDIESGIELANYSGFVADFSSDGETLAIGGRPEFPLGSSPESTSIRLFRAPR